MTRRLRNLSILFAFAAGAIAALLIWNNAKLGKVLDTYRGVPVYDNGILFFRSYSKHYAQDGYYYGQKWQCVEFIKRFFHEAKHHKMPDVMGHAKAFFDKSLPDGAMNPKRGLLQYHNGSTEKPRPDDLIVFTDTNYGHVGIVTGVNSASVEIIQQNILFHPRQRLTLVSSNGHYFISAPRVPAGWLRTPPPSVGQR